MDSETLTIIIVMILFLGLFGYMLREHLITAKANREALDRLAARRGWRIERQGRRSGRGRRSAARIVITPAGGSDDDAPAGDWRLEVVRPYHERGAHGGQNTGDTLFHAPAPRYDGGLIAVAAPTPSLIAGNATRRLLADLEVMLGGDAKDRISALAPCPAPEGSNVTVLADTGPAPGFDLNAIARIIGRWEPTYWLTPAPVVALDAQGLRLFVGGGLESPEAISAFLRMAGAVQEAAGGGPGGGE